MDTPGSVIAYDLSLVEKIAKGNSSFIKKMIEIFSRTAPADANELLRLCTKKKHHEAAELAHRLKGSVSTLQMSSIEQELKEIEFSCQDGEIDETVMNKVNLVKYVISITVQQLQTQFAK